MKTIKQMAEITGVSIRALRYYDEIDLPKPTEHTPAGKRQGRHIALQNRRFKYGFYPCK